MALPVTLSECEASMKGSCLCGAVGYEVDALAGPIVHCSCQTCRKAHAAAFTSTARVEREGQDKLTAFESSPGKLRHFCSVCGSHLMAERQHPPQALVRVATLDEDPQRTPELATP